MVDCGNRVPASGAPLLWALYYRDIRVGLNTPGVRRSPSGGTEADLTQIVRDVPLSTYGLIASATTEEICQQRGLNRVPGSTPAIQAAANALAGRHYQQYCRCPPVPAGAVCIGNRGGVGNRYMVKTRLEYTFQQRQSDDSYQEVQMVVTGEFELWGPIYSFSFTERFAFFDEASRFNYYFYDLSSVHGKPGDPCTAIEEPIGSSGPFTSASWGVTDLTTLIALYPEQCPPVPCVRPEALPYTFDGTYDEPNGEPPGRDYVATVIVEGADGKDGKNIVLNELRRIPNGELSRAILVGESETEKIFDLELEDELKEEIVQITQGLCDRETREYVETVVDIAVPILSGINPGWGAALVAISQAASLAASVVCEGEKPLEITIDKEFTGEATIPKQAIEIGFGITTPWPKNLKKLEVFVILLGAISAIPTSVPYVDTLAGAGSEGVFGLLYKSVSGFYGEPVQLRHQVNVITYDDNRTTGVQLILPIRTQYFVRLFGYTEKE